MNAAAALLIALSLGLAPVALAGPVKPIARVLPPVGEKISDAEKTALTAELDRLTTAFRDLPRKRDNANAEVFLKAVRLALENGEFYKNSEAAIAKNLLLEADRRITALRAGERPWLAAKGFVVRGYYSSIDGSAQPFGLDIPDDAPASGAPAWMWLQGRGDTRTDLHFLDQRMKKHGEFHPPGVVMVHAWGRYCVGYKSAGEQDVLDVRDQLIREKRIDPRRVALGGFSMGGAGAWLLGAHYPDRWTVLHTGAGFVDVKRYRNMSESDIKKTPPWEQLLWGQNDVPDYVRNLLNLPVVSYSGEKDKQRASAEIMAEAFQQQGAALTHFIGPGVEHKYEEATRVRVQEEVLKSLLAPPAHYPLKLAWETRTLDYPGLHWLKLTGLGEHWKEARADASLDAVIPKAARADITTTNVTSLRLESPTGEAFNTALVIHVDGQELRGAGAGKAVLLSRAADGKWRVGPPEESTPLRKRPGLQGPIDDAFTASFLHVLPDRPCAHPAVERWVKFESAHQISRWRALMRGEPRVKRASEVTPEDIKAHHLILWGDAAANDYTAKVLPKLPVGWTAESVTTSAATLPAVENVPVLIYPNPLNPDKYVVLNSGLTFREAHSKTNSLQNPKLPDWAVINLKDDPDDETPGKVVDAGFFDEAWQWKTAR